MKFWRLLTLPGYALSATARFGCLALGAFIVAFAVIASLWTRTDTLQWTLDAVHVWAALNAILWVFLADAVLLARDARTLRLPALECDALISLGLYGVVGVALPALLLGWTGGRLLTLAIILLFGAGLGAAFALLPTYLAVFALFADRIPVALSPWLPLPLQPGFNAWAGPLVVLLWLALAWRIHGLMRGKHSLQAPHGPMLMAFWRSNLGWGSGATANRWRPRTTWQGPTWARPTVDLRGCGPGHAECSLRMALGGWWMPQTWRSRAWQCVLLLAGLMVGALFLLVQTAADQRDHTAGLATGLGGAGSVVFFGTLVSALLTIATVRLLYRRWGKANAELPLLAVLPGLGGASAVKHALLRASLLPALGVQLALVLLLLIPAGSMHPGAAGEAVLLLGPLGSSGLMCAFALMVFGADPMRGWDMALATGAGYVWIGLSAGIVGLSAGSAVAVSDTALLVLAIGWSVFFVALLWLGRRGWRALQRQPHPFLVD